jgi:hypothetical protein
MSFASARLIDHLHTIPQPSDDGWLAEARPGLLASCPQDLLIFGFQYAFDQAHVVLLAFRGPKARTAEKLFSVPIAPQSSPSAVFSRVAFESSASQFPHE